MNRVLKLNNGRIPLCHGGGEICDKLLATASESVDINNGLTSAI